MKKKDINTIIPLKPLHGSFELRIYLYYVYGFSYVCSYQIICEQETRMRNKEREMLRIAMVVYIQIHNSNAPLL